MFVIRQHGLDPRRHRLSRRPQTPLPLPRHCDIHPSMLSARYTLHSQVLLAGRASRASLVSRSTATLPRLCRTFVTETPSTPKPRASTPLRRDAGASLPIRANPKPTRGSIQPVLTLATAERFALARLRPFLSHYAQPLAEAWWVPRWSTSEAPDAPEGEIFIFSNGSFVCWGLPEADAHAFAKNVIAKAGIEINPIKEHETEELDFVTDPTEYVRPH
jgi:uncharacterized Rmd1/YagE family protein